MGNGRETDLYAPVKAHLEAQGFEVKGEIEGCDLVARRGDALVVVELKRRMGIDLLLQAVDRQSVSDHVYVAIERPRRRGARWRSIIRLCRRLGVGLIAVRLASRPPSVEVYAVPGPYRPPKRRKRWERVRREFDLRVGDPNLGGSARTPIVTAYRQAALRLAHRMRLEGETSPRALREATGVDEAGPILQRNYYGWFVRVRHGVYRLTPAGEAALAHFAADVRALGLGGEGLTAAGAGGEAPGGRAAKLSSHPNRKR